MVTFDELEKADVSDLSVRVRVEAFYKGTVEVSKFAGSVMIPLLRGQINLNDKEKSIVGTYYRMYLWIRSMVAMNGRIYFQAAAAAARSLFELLLDMKILATDKTGQWVERFHVFPEIEKFRVAGNLMSFCDSHPNIVIRDVSHRRAFINKQGRRQRIHQSIVKYWGRTKKGKPNRPEHWTGKKVQKRAHHLGLKYEELYIRVYPLLSWYIHSGSTGYVDFSPEGLEACFGVSHSVAQEAFLEATLICAHEMKISKVLQGLPKVIADLRQTPAKVLTEEQIRILEKAKLRFSTD